MSSRRNASRSSASISRRGRVLGDPIIYHVSWNDPSLMQVSADNGKWSHTLDECLKKGSMRKGPLVPERSEVNFMPQKMRDIDLPFRRCIKAMREIDAVATARALVTHLRINGANDTLIDNEERSTPNGNLVKTLMFLIISLLG